MIRRFRLILFAFTLLASFLIAQTEESDTSEVKIGWYNGLIAGLNLSQSHFDNWSRGGENSLAWQILIDGDFDYYQPMWNLDMLLKINYGRSKIGSQEDRKTNDELRFDAVYNYHVWDPVEPYASARFLSQMDDGFEYSDTSSTKISGAFDPAYLTLALGLGYKYEELLKLNLGPAAKYTYADEFAAIYTDDADTESIEKQRWEGGFEFVAQLDWPITEDILFKSNLTTFTDAERFSTDINFDNILTAKVNSWLNFNIQGQLIYDDDVLPRAQWREAIAIGLSYNLF
jgi:hypothetical protein